MNWSAILGISAAAVSGAAVAFLVLRQPGPAEEALDPAHPALPAVSAVATRPEESGPALTIRGPTDVTRFLGSIRSERHPLRRADRLRQLADSIPPGLTTTGLREAQRLLGEADRATFLPRLAFHWGSQMGARACESTEALPAAVREGIRERVLLGWLQEDVTGCLAWFQSTSNRVRREPWLLPLASALAQADPTRGQSFGLSLPAGPRQAEYWEILFSRWVETDPVGAARAGLVALATRNQAHLLGGVLGTCFLSDPAEALQLWGKLRDTAVRRRAIPDFARKVAEVDPAAATRLAQELPPGPGRVDLLAELAELLARQNPENARLWARSLGNPEEQSRALARIDAETRDRNPAAAAAEFARQHAPADAWQAGEIAEKLAAQDPTAALRWAENLRSPAERSQALSATVRVWAAADPAAAAASLPRLPAGPSRTEVTREVAQAWAERDLAAATAWARSLTPGPGQLAALDTVASQWLETDPQRAVSLLDSLPLGGARDAVLSNLTGQWAESSPSDAAQFVKGLTNRVLQSRLALDIATRWVEHDPVDAAQFALQLPPGNERTELLASALRQQAASDPRSAVQWAAGLADAAAREAALAAALGRWAEHDPDAAANQARQFEDPEIQRAAAMGAINGWATRDPERAAEWVTSFDDAELRRSATESLARVWAAEDPARAAAWLAGQPRAVWSDGALEPLVEALEGHDPEAALSWVQEFQDEEVRQRETNRLARQWLGNYPDAARAWLEKTGLAPGVAEEPLKDAPLAPGDNP